jgi:hypothetical protein
MGLASPWLLLGLGALAVPVLVHLVQREEASGRVFPSLMFVRRIPFEVRRRRRIRDRALLALRCIALTALVLAFAGPYLDDEPSEGAGAVIHRDRVLLLDRSYSMSHPRRWKRAVEEIRERIEALAAGERAALVAFDDAARVVAELTADRGMLRASLARTKPGDGRTGLATAFGAAERILARSGAQRREVVIVSDLQRSALDESGALPLGEGVELEIVPVAGAVGANATVVDARLAPRRDAGVEDTLVVRVRNTGDATLDEARLHLEVDGLRTDTRPLTLAAGEERALTFPLVLAADHPTRVGLQVGPDALAADDRFHAVLAPRRPVKVALIEGERPRAHQGVFIEEALRLARAPAFEVRRMRMDDIDRPGLDAIDVLIFDDVLITQAFSLEFLADFVTRGGGVLIVAGPEAGAEWPGGTRELFPGTLGAMSTRNGVGARFEVTVADHPLWTAPGFARDKTLASARIRASRSLSPKPGDRLLARADDGAPLLVERVSGAGRVLALATTADPRWGTLALEPGFVPFAHAAVAYLAGRTGWSNAYVAGEVVDLVRHAGNLPEAADWRDYLASGGAVVVETPAGAAERVPGLSGALFRTRAPGIYEAHRADGRGASLPFAVNVGRDESLLAAALPAELERRIVRRPRSAATAAKSARRKENDGAVFGAIGWLLMLAAIALMIESLLANRISARRAAGAAA